METQFSADMHRASELTIVFLRRGKIDKAEYEVQWIRDHSVSTTERDRLFVQLAKDWETLISSSDADRIEARINELREAAIRAGRPLKTGYRCCIDISQRPGALSSEN